VDVNYPNYVSPSNLIFVASYFQFDGAKNGLLEPTGYGGLNFLRKRILNLIAIGNLTKIPSANGSSGSYS